MAKSSNPMDAAAAENQQGRQSMGKEGIKFTAAQPKSGKAVKRGNTAAGDPAGIKANRKNVPAGARGETHGAAYSVGSKYMKQTDPAAGATQANGRIIPAVMQRQAPNFQSGMGDSY